LRGKPNELVTSLYEFQLDYFSSANLLIHCSDDT
jgi:hypothetical protein